MTEQTPPETEDLEEKMDPQSSPVFDKWIAADGRFKADGMDKHIEFMSRTEGQWGFVRVVGGKEGYTKNDSKKFFIPGTSDYEILGCKVFLTKADTGVESYVD